MGFSKTKADDGAKADPAFGDERLEAVPASHGQLLALLVRVGRRLSLC
jgi:hypothetical protein